MDAHGSTDGHKRPLMVMGERHHRSWVGPPDYYDRIGALQFAVLILLGMREHHTMLDIGCGSLRGGRLSIMYLNRGNYFGLEPERWVLEEGVVHELSDGLLALKKPTFSHTEDFSTKEFGVDFDYALASGMFMHAAPAQIMQCFDAVADALAPEGMFIGAFIEGEADSDHDSWTYPEIQRYTGAGLSRMANSAGLRLHLVDWPHTFGHRWFVASRKTSTRAIPVQLDLSVFTWSQYLQDQITEHGGQPRAYADYLKEDLRQRIEPTDAPRVLPQVLF
jgi:SAM-dependent methyltransferase